MNHIKTYTILLIIFFAVTASSTLAGTSETERITILVGLDQNGQGSQDIHIPISWSDA